MNNTFNEIEEFTTISKLITTPNKLIYFENEGNILIDKTKKIKKDIPYINFELLNGGYRFKLYYKDKNHLFSSNIPIETANIKIETVKKDELTERFNPRNFDLMYLIDKETGVKYINCEDLKFGKSIIPSKKKIKKLAKIEKNNQEFLCSLFSVRPQEKIDAELTEIPIYRKGLFDGYHNILITAKDGMFDINTLGLSLIKDNQFKLALGKVPKQKITTFSKTLHL